MIYHMTTNRVLSFLSIGKLSLIFFVLSAAVTRLTSNSFLLIAVSCISIILIPLLAGKALIAIFWKDYREDFSSFVSSYIISWLTGFIVIYFSAAILTTFNFLDPVLFTFFIIVLPIAYLIIIEERKNKSESSQCTSLRILIKTAFGNKFVIPLIIVAGILPLLYLSQVQPFPLAMTQSGGRIRASLEFINNGTIDLVHGYSHILSPIQSLSAILYDLHPLQILSATPYLMHIIFPFIIYLLSYKLSKDPVISLIPAFVSPWFFLGGSNTLTTLENTNMLFFMFPMVLYACLDRKSPFPSGKLSESWLIVALAIIFLSPLTYLLGKGGSVIPGQYFIFLSIFLPAILIGLYLFVNRRINRRISLLFTIIVNFMLMQVLHPYLGTLLVFFSMGFFFAAYASGSRKVKSLRILSVALIIATFTMILIGLNGPTNFIFTQGIFGISNLQGTASDLTIQQKWSTFLDFGPAIMVYIFLFLSLGISVFGKREYLSFAFSSNLMLFFTFLPEGTLWRSEIFINPLAAILLSYGCYLLWIFLKGSSAKISSSFELSTKRFLQRIRLIRTPSWVPKTFFAFLIIIILLPIVSSVKIDYYNNADFTVYGEGYFSYFQTYDVSCSFWILNHYRQDNILIISDPATMYYIGSLTAKDTLWTQYIDPFPTSIYPNSTWDYMSRLKDAFINFSKNNLNIIENLASKIYPNLSVYDKILIIVTPHTYYWLYENNIFPTRVRITSVNSTPVVNDLQSMAEFTLVYKQSEFVYVFQAPIT